MSSLRDPDRWTGAQRQAVREDELEFPSCPLCGSEQHDPAYVCEAFEPYKVDRCTRCAFHFLCPRPTPAFAERLYSGTEYFSSQGDAGYTSYAAQEEPLRRTFKRLLENMQRRGLTGGSLLEVGCGYGYLLAEARPYFDRLEATDFSPKAVEVASQYADRVYCGGVDRIEPSARYDVVVTNHVIEHVHEPHGFVSSLTARLRTGGKLVVSTPNMGSLWRRAMGCRWPSFKIPEHILYFDRKALRSVLERAGVHQITPLPYPHAFPLPLALSKLGMKAPRLLQPYSVWIPMTTVAAFGTVG